MTNKVPLCNEKTIQEGIQLSQRTGINAIIAFGNETIQHIAKGIQSEFFKRRHIYFPIIIIPTNLSSTIFDTRYKVLHSETDAYEDKDNFKALESQLVLLDTKLVRTFHSKSLEPLKLLLFGEYLDLLLFAKLHHREVTTPSQIKSLAVVSENFDCLAHVSLEISQLRRELCLQVCDQSPWFGLVEVYSHVLELLSIQAKGFPDANDITSSEALIRIFSIYQQCKLVIVMMNHYVIQFVIIALQNQQSLDPIAEAIRQSIEDAQYKSEVNLQELLQRYRQLSKADLSRSASRSPMVHKQTSSISSSASSASSLMEGIIMLEKDKLRPTTPTERNIFATPNVNSNLKTSLKLKLLESNFLLDVVNA